MTWRKPYGIILQWQNPSRWAQLTQPRRWYRWYATEAGRDEAVLKLLPRYMNKGWGLGIVKGRPRDWAGVR